MADAISDNRRGSCCVLIRPAARPQSCFHVARRSRPPRRRHLHAALGRDAIARVAAKSPSHERAHPFRDLRRPRLRLPGRQAGRITRLPKPSGDRADTAGRALRDRLRTRDDYGVFLLTRIKEAWDNGIPNREAVAIGLERTGRIITAAALLFCIAVGAFATSQIIIVKEIGIGIALAVLIDASIVRVLLVPSLMAILGRWNWWPSTRTAREEGRQRVNRRRPAGRAPDERTQDRLTFSPIARRRR
jgi:hypothetical protein